MLNYLSMQISANEEPISRMIAPAYLKEILLFDSTEQALQLLTELIRLLKLESMELFLELQIEISKYRIEKLEEKKPPVPKTEDTVDLLSKREKEILKLVFDGLTNREIANKLFISFETVKSHRKNIRTKTDSKNTAAILKKIDLNDIT